MILSNRPLSFADLDILLNAQNPRLLLKWKKKEEMEFSANRRHGFNLIAGDHPA